MVAADTGTYPVRNLPAVLAHRRSEQARTAGYESAAVCVVVASERQNRKENQMLSSGTRVITSDNFTATIVTYAPELGGYVVSMTGNNGEIPGEQWIAAASDVRVDLLEAYYAEPPKLSVPRKPPASPRNPRATATRTATRHRRSRANRNPPRNPWTP